MAFGTFETVVRYVLPDFGRIIVLVLVMTVLFFKPHGFAPRASA
jgi:branched-subunit amino acid ABC-type transport system permease component